MTSSNSVADSELDKLIDAQRDYLDQILKIQINFKKLTLQKRTRSAVQNRLQTLETFWKGCLNRHDIILLRATKEQKRVLEYFTTDAFASITESVDEVRDFLSEILVGLQVNQATAGSDSSTTIVNKSSIVNLPPINLPTFAGDLTSWPAFRDLYVSLVESRSDLNNVQKLHYLKGSLRGQAVQILRNVDVTEANYAAAWDLLKKRYENPRAIVYAYLDKFWAIPKVGVHRERDLRNLRDQAHEIYHAVLAMKRPINLWEDQFIFIILSKLDPQTRHEWELTQRDVNTFPTYSELDDYLSYRLRAFETSGPPVANAKNSGAVEREVRRGTIRSHQSSASGLQCFVCQGGHPLYQCQTFLNSAVEKRIKLLTTEKRCFNCFRKGHRPANCDSKNVCRTCKRKHHTLLHLEVDRNANHNQGGSNTPPSMTDSVEPSLPPTIENVVSNNCADFEKSLTILPTATVRLSSDSGRSVVVRALIDQGSQATFVSESLVQTLKPDRRGIIIGVKGIGSKRVGATKQMVTLTLQTCTEDNTIIKISALVLQRLTSYLPPPLTVRDVCPIIRALPLADRNPNSKEPVQLILGSDYYGSILRDGVVHGPTDSIIAQKTIFGWILSGPSNVTSIDSDKTECVISNHIHTLSDIQSELTRFWEVEEVPDGKHHSEAEIQCENHFKLSHARLPNGRYMVRLPFKSERPIPIGDTRTPALSLFFKQENRLHQKPELKRLYQDFLQEYLDLSHMERVSTLEEQDPDACYFPHHPVLKSSSTTTKVRVVFNASFKSMNGHSLNDFLHVGSNLQADLFAIILHWRQYQFVYSTDLEKMFRQILVHPEDRDFQRIFWRQGQQEKVSSFRLCTVTYGTACAPFLANRVIQQLAIDEGSKFPVAARILRNNIYVDDVLFGADSIDALKDARWQLCQLLRAGVFRPYKWTANHPALLSDIPDGDLAVSSEKRLEQDSSLKVLGIYWQPRSDAFAYQIVEERTIITKREFLSLLARIFDPHGWAAPVIVSGKILMQSIWLLNLGWDDPLPSSVRESCRAFQSNLSHLNLVKIPRWTGQSQIRSQVQLHGYCDASNLAYGAAIYLRIRTENDEIISTLLYAKTRVAPVKILSVPRLELCAAILLVKALRFVTEQLSQADIPTFCWTDSMVVLFWLQEHPSRWKPFVANRVSTIQTSFPNASWRHVPSEENPADCASRGLTPQQLLNHSLWWHGPPWLLRPDSDWPQSLIASDKDEISNEQRIVQSHPAVTETSFEIADNVSSWPKLLRVTCYIFRFLNRTRRIKEISQYLWVSAAEIEAASTFWCRQVQQTYFIEVIHNLKEKKSHFVHGSFKKLNLFIGQNGVLRVGGRLCNAPLTESEKFPILLPQCRISYLLALYAHTSTLHGGPQVSLRFLRQRYWILNARSLIKKICFNCVICTRHRASLMQQKMGDLPAARVTPSRPFAHTGIDYAGPFFIRSSKGRGIKTHKAYCIVFVCLSTKAIHLECADDATTAGFLAAFDRFTSRRGLPGTVYSDNGTNFVGADRELSNNLKRVLNDPALQSKCASDGIDWQFTPPAAPHFGGLWEAGVKSVKYHLKRIIGSFRPTFEEFSTILCKIEGILNSRPIAPLNDDPDSFDALTPGHFLVGSYIKMPPAPSVLELNENRLSRWQCVQKCMEAFWKVWRSDYINTLQQRLRWHKKEPNLRIGELVLIKSPNLPPSKWELGRVTKCFYGQDNLVRVVLVRTASSEYKRPINQLCKLPVDSHTEQAPTPS